MGTIAVLGERITVEPFALAGAVVFAADDPSAVCTAWERLAPDVAVVVVTRAAAEALRDRLVTLGDRLVVTLP